MMRSLGILIGLVCVTVTCASAGVAQRWSAVSDPAPGPPRVIGSYTAGCVQGAQALPMEGPGFQAVRRQRQRFYGHPQLLSYIQELAQRVAAHNLGRLFIGDLGQARGGPTPTGHRSHQTGLDADIWLWFDPSKPRLTEEEQATYPAASMLTTDHQQVDRRYWSARQGEVLRLASTFPDVERIFVHPVIKQAVCEQFANAAWLQKLRPWWGHHEHFHVRLRCPEGDPECTRQEPVADGHGCGSELAWWLSEGIHQSSKGPGTTEVQLPAACQDVLKK